MKLSGRADVIAPTASLLTKTITVPHVDPSKAKDIISFEAEKNIPYALNEVSWDYQVVSSDGVETEILLTSMKADEADDFCAAVTFGSVSPASIQASSILDYNAWKYCGLEENVMILNIGAKASNLIIAREDGLFVRSVPIGGNSITQAISDNLGKSFMQAESIKRSFFAEPARMNSVDSVAELLRNSVRSISKRIAIELKRSILAYKRKGTVETPKILYITGRGAMAPGLAEYLIEELQVEVKFFDPVSALAVAPSVNSELLSSNFVHLSELVGAAAKAVIKNGMGVNLLPKHITEAFAFERKRPFMIIAAALLLLSTIPPYLALSESTNETNKCAKALTSKISSLEQRTADFNKCKQDASNIVSKISDLESLATTKSNWLSLFADLEQRLFEMKDVWLDDLKVLRSVKGGKPDYRLQVSGRLLLRNVSDDVPYDPNSTTEYTRHLLNIFTQSEFIEKVDGDNVKIEKVASRILKFNFTLVVNPNKPI